MKHMNNLNHWTKEEIALTRFAWTMRDMDEELMRRRRERDRAAYVVGACMCVCILLLTLTA